MGPRSRLLAGVAALAAGALALSGCGSSSSGTNADPASVAPASARLYAGLVIKPSGGPTSDAVSAAKRLTHLADPYGSLAQALLSTKTSHIEFGHDIEPWIGARAGIFITSIDTSGLPAQADSAQTLLEGDPTSAISSFSAGAFGSQGAQGAIVLDTSDLTGARSFLEARAREQHAHGTSYRGVSYQVSPSGVAEGIVDRFAVIGSESGLKSVIDTSLGGASITGAPDYEKPPSNAIASAYIRPKELLASMQGPRSATTQGVLLLGRLLTGAREVSLSVTPTANSISLQGEVHSTGGSSPLFDQGGVQALGALPGDSWLAAGVGNAGANLGRKLSLLHSFVPLLGLSKAFASLGGAGLVRLLDQLTSPAAKLQKLFAGWAGPAGVFASGTGLFNLEAGLVIASKDPASSRAAVYKLASLLRSSGESVSRASIAGTDAAVSVRPRGFPAVLYIADGQGKFVVGLGEASVLGALSPSSTLSSSVSYSEASSALGQGISPSLIVEFPTLLGLLEGIGLTQNPAISSFVPYLKSLGTLTAGAVSQSGAQRFRLVLGLAAS